MKKIILFIGLILLMFNLFAQNDEVDELTIRVKLMQYINSIESDLIVPQTDGTAKLHNISDGLIDSDGINLGQMIDTVNKYSFVQPIDSLFLNRDAVTTGHNPYKVDVDTTNGALRMYNDEVDIAMQMGQELWLKIKNNNGSTFDNGIIVYISGGETGFPTVSVAHNRDFETVDAIGMLTHDVEAGTFGFLTTYGTVGGLDTSGETPGAIVYVDTLTAGKNWTTTIPEFSNFQYEIGFIHTVDAVEGKIFINPKGQIDDVMHNINNANILENFDFTESSNGTTITGTLESSDGKDYLTVRWSDGFAKISVPCTITIPAGTDHNSQTAYIYIPKSTGVLTSSTSYFPIGTQYKTIAKTEAWSALRTQTNGLKGLQNYNDFIASTGSLRGRIAQIGNWQRLRNLKYINGSNGTVTVRPNGAASDTVTFGVTQGNWSQSNEQVLLAMDMFTGDSIYVLNYPDHPDTAIIDLNEILIDATGASLTGRSWTWVFWIVQNKTGQQSHMYVNLPNGSYSSGAEAEADVSQFKVTDIPYEMRSYSGFVTEVVMTHANPSGGTWTVYSTTNIQGNEPGYSGGGGGDGGGGTFDSDTDTPASKAGSSNKLVGVDLGEANLVYKSVTVDGSGNMDVSGGITTNGDTVATLASKIVVTVGQENADYITNGTNDEVEINQAIDFVNAKGGGIVFLKEGSFTCVADIVIKDNVTLAGDSKSSLITGNISTPTGFTSNHTIKNITLTGDLDLTFTREVLISDMTITGDLNFTNSVISTDIKSVYLTGDHNIDGTTNPMTHNYYSNLQIRNGRLIANGMSSCSFDGLKFIGDPGAGVDEILQLNDVTVCSGDFHFDGITLDKYIYSGTTRLNRFYYSTSNDLTGSGDVSNNFIVQQTSASDFNKFIGDYKFDGNIGLGTDAVSTWKLLIKGEFGWSAVNTSGTGVFEMYSNLGEMRLLNGTKIVGHNQHLELTVNTPSSLDVNVNTDLNVDSALTVGKTIDVNENSATSGVTIGSNRGFISIGVNSIVDDGGNMKFNAVRPALFTNTIAFAQGTLGSHGALRSDILDGGEEAKFLSVNINDNASISSTGDFISSVTASITASTTQSQGQQALTSAINEVSVVANANDVVTMPTAVAGLRVVVINNGANILQIFPASGDNLGAGVDTSVTLAAGSNVEYVSYDVTNWEQL